MGVLSRWRQDNLLAGVDVTLNGGATEWAARTTESGQVDVEGLPAGEYQLTVAKAGLSPEIASDRRSREGPESEKIVMPERGCVEAPILMWPANSISGSVRDIDGHPVEGLTVDAYEFAMDSSGRRRFIRSAVTGANGQYTIARMYPGRYAVAVNAEPGADGEYATTFHKAAASRHGARPIVIANEESVTGIDLVVPRKRRLLSIKVQVLWPDKQPVASAKVANEHLENGIIDPPNSAGSRSSWTDRDGFVTIPVYEGTKYTLSATYLRRRSDRTVAEHFTNRVKIVAAPDTTVTLILNPLPGRPLKR